MDTPSVQYLCKKDKRLAKIISIIVPISYKPYEDGAFLQAYRWAYKTDDPSTQLIKKRCKKWKPYSSTAAPYFYRALDAGLTKEEFHLYK